MKIVVFGGSPKGENSVTLQYVAFLEKKFPQHDFKALHIAQQVRSIENEEKLWNEILEEVKTADGILWAFPLYYCLVHGNYKRFIELIFERRAEEVFQGKHAAILTTSIHFFDHTAINYMHGICDDMDMKVYGAYSAEMADLLKEEEREKLLLFAEGFFDAIKRDAPVTKVFPPLVWQNAEYLPGEGRLALDTGGRKVVIVTDCEKDQVNLRRMIERFAASFGSKAEVINLHDIDIKGGCNGCIRCAYDNSCVYSGKDGFIDFYNSKVKTADILVFAGAVRDRYLSSLWKTFFDRSFFNTHIPTLQGKQVAFLISGSFSQLPNLRQIFDAYIELQPANVVGIVTDEYDDSEKIDGLLDELALRCVQYAEWGYIKPGSFLAVGGKKLFRDEVWGRLRFPFVADYKFYKDYGAFDFPQKDYVTRLRNFMFGLMLKIPSIRKEIYGSAMITEMVKPYKKLLTKL